MRAAMSATEAQGKSRPMFAREQPPRPLNAHPDFLRAFLDLAVFGHLPHLTTPRNTLPIGCPHASLSGGRHHADRKVHTSPHGQEPSFPYPQGLTNRTNYNQKQTLSPIN